MFEKYKKYIIYFAVFVGGIAFAFLANNISPDTLKGSLLENQNGSSTKTSSDLAARIKSGDNIEVIDVVELKKDLCEGGKITINQIGGIGTVVLNGPIAVTIKDSTYTNECTKVGSYSLNVTAPDSFVLDNITANSTQLTSPYSQNLLKGSSVNYNINYKLSTGVINVSTDSSDSSYKIYKGTTIVGSGSGINSTKYTLPAKSSPGTDYKIVFGSVSGYTTPSDISFSLTADGNLNFEGKYSKSQGNVSVNTDNINGSYSIYQGTNIVSSGSGANAKKHILPVGTSYKIVFSNIVGHITPSDISFDVTSGSNVVYEGKYNKIQGTVIINTNNTGGSYKIYNQDATIAGSGSGGDTAKTHLLPASLTPGTSYKIIFEGIAGYITPADISFNLVAGDTKTFEGKYTEPDQSKFSVEALSSSTFSNIIIAGTSDVLVSEYLFTATKDKFTVKKLTIINDNVADPNFDDPLDTNVISSVKIKYPDPVSAGEMKTATGSPVNGSYTFSNLDFNIEKDSTATLKVYADIKSVTTETFSLSGKKFTLGLKEKNNKTDFEAMGEISQKSVYLDKEGDVKNSSKVPTFIVRKSKPLFSAVDQTSSTMPTDDGDLYKFTVTANGGDVSFARLVFDVQTTDFDASGSDIYNWHFTNSVGEIKDVHIWGRGTLASDNSVIYIKNTLSGSGLQDCNYSSQTNSVQDGLYKIIVTFDKEQIIKSGKTETYTLKADIFMAPTGAKITVGLSDDDETNEVNTSYDFDNDNGFSNTTQLMGSSSVYNDSLFENTSGYFGDNISVWEKFRNIIWSDGSGGDFASGASGNVTSGAHTYPTIIGSSTAGTGTITSSSGSVDWTNGYGLGVGKLEMYKFVK